MAEPVLTVSNLHAGYGDAEILHDININLGHEVATIIGPNGAGKSTLIKAIFGLVDVFSGTVRLGDRDVTGATTLEMVKAGVGYVPQINNVFANLTVAENLQMGGLVVPDPDPEPIFDMFPILRERAKQKAGRLSGGQRQMVAMGRALMAQPKILLLDEPSAGLAPNLQDQVFENIARVSSDVPVLLVEQNAKKALAVSDRCYVLDGGRNAMDGDAAKILADPRIGHLYLGSHVAGQTGKEEEEE